MLLGLLLGKEGWEDGSIHDISSVFILYIFLTARFAPASTMCNSRAPCMRGKHGTSKADLMTVLVQSHDSALQGVVQFC